MASRLLFATALVALVSAATPALAWRGKVVAVADGDTITVMHLGRGERIRLFGVDTPESRQAFGTKAKEFTSALVFGKEVRVEAVDRDTHGRTVALVHVGDRTLNAELLKAGFAWLYRHFCKRPVCESWLTLESQARAARRGLWKDPAPTPPWEWRLEKKKRAPDRAGPPPPPPGASVGPYHGNVKSKVFHRAGCDGYSCRNCTAVFETRDEAVEKGYRPCGGCKP